MSEAVAPVAGDYVVDAKRDRLVIVASSLGTVFEWYDFFIYGTLAPVIATLFFPTSNPTAGLLLTLATFGAGFGVRPIGAILFGILGDKLGRKYTFLVTITLMGVATAAVGLLPGYAAIGVAAPSLYRHDIGRIAPRIKSVDRAPRRASQPLAAPCLPA